MKSPTASELGNFSKTNHEPDAVLRLEQVSVCYRMPRERIGTFKEYMIRQLQRRVSNNEFWALRNVSLEVQAGEVFGIIGPNGAGKSTLLKLVARVLRPTSGRVWARGYVAPLLEFGAGFHPELSGRENVILNGVLLGFSRKHMKQRFKHIVEFAGIGDFIDAPLRTYSSGMVARLGFAIAVDVQPDILIVDELLSAGDEAFQRKGMERIQEIRQGGASILLVTHSLAVAKRMCQRAAWLDQGTLRALGPVAEVTEQYQRSTQD